MKKTVDADPEQADPGFSRKLSRATYSPAVSLAWLVVIILALVFYLLHTIAWIEHTNQNIQHARYTEKLLLDLQAATRGYYLTGDASFLQPYRDSRPELGQALAELRARVADNPKQLELAEKIEAGSREWAAWIKQVLADYDAAAGSRPTAPVLQEGRARFDTVREQLGEFLTVEYALRDQRTRWSTRFAWTALAAITVASVVTAIAQCTSLRRRLLAITATYRGALRLAKDRRLRAQELLKALDRELKAVGEIQRSLLPLQLPTIPGLDLAASYQTSRRAGGDYYDFFRLPPEHPNDHRVRYGILIADVAGHGTPAAVLMAVTHSIAHGFEQPASPPNELLDFVNRRLCDGYTANTGTFVTAFYAIYDPAARELTYSSAGHNPPRLRRKGHPGFEPLGDAQGFPLGILPDGGYVIGRRTLRPGDVIVLYTDGITEARNTDDDEFGVARLDAALLAAPSSDPDTLLGSALTYLKEFAGDQPEDDRTMLILSVNDRPIAVEDADAAPKEAVIIETPHDPIAAIRA